MLALRHFGGWKVVHYSQPPRKAYAVSWCARDKSKVTITEPEFACVDWEREPGSDDESGCIDPVGDRYQPGVPRWIK